MVWLVGDWLLRGQILTLKNTTQVRLTRYITVAKDNFDDIIHLGDVKNWRQWELNDMI